MNIWKRGKFMDIYESCPQIENEKYKLRLVSPNDRDDLLKVYSDKAAVRFFNSDNCNGDNFYYTTPDRMAQAIKFWLREYEQRYYVRFSIIDKSAATVIGTIEIFNRISDDYFTNCGLLRLDLASDYEKRGIIDEILSLIIEPIFEWFDCDMIATKAIPEAGERICALENRGFALSYEKLIGAHDYRYDNYYVLKKQEIKTNGKR